MCFLFLFYYEKQKVKQNLDLNHTITKRKITAPHKNKRQAGQNKHKRETTLASNAMCTSDMSTSRTLKSTFHLHLTGMIPWEQDNQTCYTNEKYT